MNPKPKPLGSPYDEIMKDIYIIMGANMMDSVQAPSGSIERFVMDGRIQLLQQCIEIVTRHAKANKGKKTTKPK